MFNPANLLCGMRFVILLIAFVTAASESRSDERCEYPDVLGSMFVPLEKRLGEYRITLGRPDYLNQGEVRNHFLFSTTFSHLLDSSLKNQTKGRCEAVVDSLRFPDLHVYLSRGDTFGDIEADRLFCTQELRSILLNSKPNQDEIRASASQEVRLRESRSDASTILAAALRYIFEDGTVLNAINSIDVDTFRSVDAKQFSLWLDAQRLSVQFGLAKIPLCAGDLDPNSPSVDVSINRLPSSRTTSPRTINLSSRAARFPDDLRHVVIVGHDGILNAPDLPEMMATRKYCGGEKYDFRQNEGSFANPVVTTTRIRCLRSVQYDNQVWSVFYCDPKVCTSENASRLAAEVLMGDPEINSLARSSKDFLRGPYLVNIADN
jgi:hypothetical protein